MGQGTMAGAPSVPRVPFHQPSMFTPTPSLSPATTGGRTGSSPRSQGSDVPPAARTPFRPALPPGVVGAIGVTLWNNASNATPVPFQPMITVNSARFSGLINGNWSNVVFSYVNGTAIPAWIESGASNTSTSTVVWLNLTTPIPGRGNFTLLMNFYPKGAYVLYPRGPTGEAPYLSTPRGIHDNGAHVFLVYGGFQWTSQLANWTPTNVYNGGGNLPFLPRLTFGASGLQMMNDKTGEATDLTYNASFHIPGVVLEASWSYGSTQPNLADNLGFGIYASGVNAFDGQWEPYAQNGYYASYEFFGASNPVLLYNDVPVSGTVAPARLPSTSPGPYYLFSRIELGPASYDMSYATGNSIFETGEYQGLQTLYSGNFTSVNPFHDSNGELYVGSSTGGTSSYQYLYWLRVRAEPPNGTMPNATFSTPLFGGGVHPSGITLDPGQSVSLSASGASGGVPPLVYQWYSFSGVSRVCHTTNAIPGAHSLTLNVTAFSNTTYCFSVEDATGLNVSSYPGVVYVSAGLTAGSLTPLDPVIDRGEAINLTAHPSGGVPPYVLYQWYNGTATSCSGDHLIVGANRPFLNVSPSANATYCYSVQDSSPATPPATNLSAIDPVTVVNRPIIQSFLASPPQVDIGQSVVFTAIGASGIPPYSYVWGPPGVGLNCTAPNSGNLSCTPDVVGRYAVSVQVVDSHHFYSSTALLNLTVYARPGATPPVPSAQNVTTGAPVTFKETPASNGSGGLAYQWSPSGPGTPCSPSLNLLTCTFAQPGAYSVKVTITDSDGVSDNATSPTVTVSAGGGTTLSGAVITPAVVSVRASASVVLQASVTCTGGLCPTGLRYGWALNNTLGNVTPSTSASNSTTFTAGSTPGTVLVTLTVSLGTDTVVATRVVNITESASGPALTAVTVIPGNINIVERVAQRFSASPTCSPAPCPFGGIAYTWSLSDPGVGQLNATSGESVLFTAGPSPGSSSLTLRAVFGGHTVWSNASVMVVAASGHASSSPTFGGLPLSLWLILGVVVSAVALALVLSRRRRRNHGEGVGSSAPKRVDRPAVVRPPVEGTPPNPVPPETQAPLPEWSED